MQEADSVGPHSLQSPIPPQDRPHSRYSWLLLRNQRLRFTVLGAETAVGEGIQTELQCQQEQFQQLHVLRRASRREEDDAEDQGLQQDAGMVAEQNGADVSGHEPRQDIPEQRLPEKGPEGDQRMRIEPYRGLVHLLQLRSIPRVLRS